MARSLQLFFILFIILYLRNCNGSCTTSHCPPDKPFCTEHGCVFECPKSAYINGTRCVVDCGTWFVNNRTCMEQCHPEHFIRETPKLAGRDIFIEKHCVNSCSPHEYTFNNTCVRACPVTHIYISERNCSTQCPESAPFLTNLTTNGYNTYQCVNQCPHLVENGYCTDHCSDHLNIFNSTCVSVCPDEYHLMFEQKCVSKCPDLTIYVQDFKCMTRCPLEKPYLYNGSCVSGCAQGFKTLKNKIWHCVESCNNEMFIYNQTCVSTCPSGYVVNSNTCDKNCSDVLPFSCEVTNNPRANCGATDFYRIYQQQKYIICVKQCPDNMYILNSSCVYSCPANFYYLGRKCVQNCSTDLPFLYNETSTSDCDYFSCSNLITKLTCIEACPSDTYSFKRFCYSTCPAGLYTSGKTCTTTCSQFLTKNKTVTLGTYERHSEYWEREWRKKNVKATMVECVTECGPEYFQYNTTCVEECPQNIKYVTNGTCHANICDTKYMYNKSKYIECSDICDERHYIYQKQCVNNCPEQTLVYNRTCVTVCPNDCPFIENQSIELFCGARSCPSVSKFCVEKCSNDTIALNNTCVSKCPSHTFVYNNKCVLNCPENNSFASNNNLVLNPSKSGMECLTRCPRGRFDFNQTCVTKCPKGTFYLNDNSCVYECPDEKPLGYKKDAGYYDESWTCIHSCEGDQVFENGDCRYSCTEPKIPFDGQCRDKCPEGYIWFDGCCGISSVIIHSILLFVVPEIMLLFLGRKILKEYFTVVWMALRCRRFASEEDEESFSEEVVNDVEGDVPTSNLEMQVCSDEQLQLLS